MMGRIEETSPRFKARMAGLFYLLTILTGGLGFYVGSRFLVSGDAAATATKILANQPLFRFGYAVQLLATVCYVVVTALFYELFKPVSRNLSLLAAFFSLVGCSFGVLSCLLYFAPLVVLRGAQSLGSFQVEQLQALALLFLKLSAQANNTGLVLFGFYCLLIGYLIVRSTFLPRAVGALMVIAGLGWLTFLSPPLAEQLAPFNMAASILGEASLTVCLLVMGVNAQRWHLEASSGMPERPSTPP